MCAADAMEDIMNTDVQILSFVEDKGKMTLRNRLSGTDFKPLQVIAISNFEFLGVHFLP